MSFIAKFWFVLSIIITIAFIVCFVYFIVNPIPLKFICRCYIPDVAYEPNKNANIDNRYSFYTNPNKANSNNLVVVFPGGAGLFSELNNIYGLTNTLNENLGPDYDILALKYPVRFKSTIQESLIEINDILLQFIHYDNVHAIGVSFGALLIGAFYHKEMSMEAARSMGLAQIGMKFKSFVGICGMYDVKFNAKLITWLFEMYIMRGTPGIKRYTCYNMTIPRYVVSAKSDFLLAQTSQYIQNEELTKYKVYDSTTLPHAFPQYINFPEAIEVLQEIATFIKMVDNV